MKVNPFEPSLPNVAEIVLRTQESPTIFTLHTRFLNPANGACFSSGQFNMLYLYGVGEVPISISSDPADATILSHTIRAVGRVTNAMQNLKQGDMLGIRGPYGRGWPLTTALGKDVVVITGGLGCAPTVSIIKYILARRKKFGRLTILQGVKHSEDLIWRKQYEEWQKDPDTEVYLAADQSDSKWLWHTGFVTELIQTLQVERANTVVMMCGPELMMHGAIAALTKKNIPESAIYLSMERNMVCAIGLCGHCQYGGLLVCKDGPVFAYPEIKSLFNVEGF